ncbi:MAG: poly-gamma-glutamate system protein [candidate division Zixibacteria bacterium]
MRPRLRNPSIRLLIFLAMFSALIFYLAEDTRSQKQAPYWGLKNRAAYINQRAQEAIRQTVEDMGIPIDFENDPNGTGIIGDQYTLVTTDRGELRSKLIATNPNFAAVIIEMFKKAGLRKGDLVAVGMTGSFPGVNIAFYSACEVFGIEPVVITSVGASTWGANHPDFTWLDMERVLFDSKIISYRSVAASLGGGTDNGRGLSLSGRELLIKAVERHDVELIFSGNPENMLEAGGSLRANMDRRLVIYDKRSKGHQYAAYINIGGGLASLGSSQNGKLIPSGVNLDLYRRNFPARGVVNIMAEKRIPIIHLLRLPEIAEDYGLPLDVVPPPIVGEGPLFYRDEYSISSTIIYALILMIVVAAAIRIDLKYYIRKQTKILFPPKGSNEPEL